MLVVIGIGLEKRELIGIGLKKHMTCISDTNVLYGFAVRPFCVITFTPANGNTIDERMSHLPPADNCPRCLSLTMSSALFFVAILAFSLTVHNYTTVCGHVLKKKEVLKGHPIYLSGVTKQTVEWSV